MIDLLILLACIAACTALMVACAWAAPLLRLVELALAALPLNLAWRRAAPWLGGSPDDLPWALRLGLLAAALVALGILALLAARPGRAETLARSYAARTHTRRRYRNEVRSEAARRVHVHYRDGRP